MDLRLKPLGMQHSNLHMEQLSCFVPIKVHSKSTMVCRRRIYSRLEPCGSGLSMKSGFPSVGVDSFMNITTGISDGSSRFKARSGQFSAPALLLL